MAASQNEKILLAEAAEHLVISRLLRLGYAASQAPRTWRADDILIDQGPSFQVKATDKGLNWMVGKVRQNDRRFYALADFKLNLAPVVYVLSNEVVRRASQAHHELAMQAHPTWQDSGIRNIMGTWRRGLEPDEFPNGWLEAFRERWDQLPAPVRDVSAD